MKKSENLPFRYEEKEVMSELLEEVRAALKDSDAAEEKEMIRNFQREVSERFMFVVVGSAGVGKTSLFLHLCFRRYFQGERRGRMKKAGY